MRHLLEFHKFGLDEALFTPHYVDRMDLRIGNLAIIDKDGGKYNTAEAVKRIKLMVNKIANEHVSHKSVTSAKKITIFDFGDILIKYDGKLYKPTLSVPNDYEKDPATKKYIEPKRLNNKIETGSRFGAIVGANEVITLMIYHRDAGIPEIFAACKRHLKEKNKELQNAQEMDHLYVKDQINIVDLDLDLDEFVASLSDKEVKSKLIDKVPKEMVFSPGTKLKYYKDSQVVQKSISRTERVGQGVRIFFDDKTFRVFNPGDVFIVTPAKQTASDQTKTARMGGSDSTDFVGRIKEVGTYSAEKYQRRGAAAGGAADYVRILATSML